MRKIWILLSLIFGFISCSDDEIVYRVDNTLNLYLQRFLAEASVRGYNFDPKSSGLRLEFGELENDVAGRCYFEDPIRIVIDKSYWTQIAGSQNVDELYENLVFHELGHGLLNRQHTNEYLNNGDWKSIMCGGDTRDDRSWNINYRSVRREYYLNELFNANTPAPNWATQTINKDLNADTLAYNFEFNSNLSTWVNSNNSSYLTSVSNGNYIFENKSSGSILVPKRFSINTNSDFYIETKIKSNTYTIIDQFGIVFGQTDSPINVNFFTISNKQRMFMGNTDCFGWYTELLKPEIQPNEYNILGIRKSGSKLYYFINDVCVYYDELTNPKSGFDFGFDVAANSKLEVDYFKFYIPKSSFRSAHTVRIQDLTPIMKPINNNWSNK